MNPDQLVISRADTNDAATLTELSVTTFRDTFQAQNSAEDMDKYITEEMNDEKLTKELGDEDNLFFIAWIGDKAIGYAKLRSTEIPPELAGRNPIEIERLYVRKEYHGFKAGAAIMTHCINYALSRKHDVIWLGVWEHNHRAIKFYTKWNFEIFGSHGFRLGDDDQTDVLMKKEL